MQSILDLIEESAPHMPPMPPRFIVIVILRSGSGIAGVERVFIAGKEVQHRHKIWGGDLPVLDGAARLYVPAEDDSACDMNSLADIFWSTSWSGATRARAPRARESSTCTSWRTSWTGCWGAVRSWAATGPQSGEGRRAAC